MRARAKLPAELWLKISRAVVYLYNRILKYDYNWKAPYDGFHTYVTYRDSFIIKN